MLKLQTGIAITHVPYKGSGPAITDLLGGHIQMMFAGPFAVEQHIKSGRLRPLAIADAKRSTSLPNVPTMREAGFAGIENGTWYGLAAPASTPKPIIEAIYSAVRSVAGTPALKSRLDVQGVEAVANSPAVFTKIVSEEIKRWTKVVRDAGIRAD
jgi:tripartite-type tricarboxylate transporter receptor subunit TctC